MPHIHDSGENYMNEGCYERFELELVECHSK